MDYCLGGESPAILQLHKWPPSKFNIDLSEFREGFISPTRELLLLLSHQCEALLLPLVAGESVNNCVSEPVDDERLQCRSSEVLNSELCTESSRSDLKDDIPCTSASVGDFDNGFSLENGFLRSNSYGFVYDVNSLAWGVCGDTYNQHKEASFREFLFVSSSDGVTVHAFRKPDIDGTALEGEFGEGRWVDWGPSSMPAQILKVQDSSSSCVASKRWLRSFFIKVETIKSKGNTWTRFPEKTSFPCSAEVVSFSVFDSTSPLLNLLNQDCSIINREDSKCETILKPENETVVTESDGLYDDFCIGSYKCSRVFSSNSYDLIGFVLTYEACAKCTCRPCTGVGRFCFSDNLLVCLNASGLIYFYAALSGEFVAYIDILRASGLNPHSGLCKQEKVVMPTDLQIKQPEVQHKSTSQRVGFLGKGIFRKLLIGSHTSLLAVADEYGVVYVMCTGNYFSNTYDAHDKLLQQFQHLGSGMFVGWKVAGSDIGHQRVYSNGSSTRNEKLSFLDWAGKNTLEKIQTLNCHGHEDLLLSGFSKIAVHTFHNCEARSHLVRKVFLPTERFSEDDYICFSSMGITRLMKKYDAKNHRTTQIVHFNLHTSSAVHDDRCLNTRVNKCYGQGKEASVGEAVGCTFQGLFYLVTEVGLSVVLPSVSAASDFLPIETIGYQQRTINTDIGQQLKKMLEIGESIEPFLPWKVEVLDKVLLYEGPAEADQLCLTNGWELKISRLRRLQMALEYLKYDEIEQSLEMLVGINLAEEGILRLLFAAIYLMSHRSSNDNEISAASRLLALASHFTTKMIWKCGLLQHQKDAYRLPGFGRTSLLSLPPALLHKVHNKMEHSRSLHDMAHLLEIIRNLQYRLSSKFKKSSLGLVGGRKELSLAEANLSQDESQLSILSADAALSETPNQQELLASVSSVGSNNEKLALMYRDSLDFRTHLDIEDSNGVSVLVPQGGNLGKKVFPFENPKEMIARWKLDNLDLKTVVKDALLSGRLPLAVLQLHLHRFKDSETSIELPDTFSEVRDIGRAIAYDLFLKGETELAVATLQRLGEDVETCLKQLLFGTVRRSLRLQIAEDIRRYGYLGPYEWETFEKILLIERMYPSSSFWRTFVGRREALKQATSTLISPALIKLQLLPSYMFNNFIIECGEIDGVVLGSWTSINGNSPDPVVDEDTAHAGYWAAAAVWSRAWDQRTIDRIVLDQPFIMGVHVLWESQLEYYLCHNDFEEVSKLLDLIPTSVLSDGSLQITLDNLQHAPEIGSNCEYPDYNSYICSIEELDSVCIDIPGVKIFRFPANAFCSMWLRTLMEQELAKKFIFLNEYWEGTGEIVALLARSGLMTSRSDKMTMEDYSVETSSDLNITDDGRFHVAPMEALHKLLVHYCVQYNLPNLLDLYLDHHKLALDNDLLGSLQEAAGDCQWAKWLLLSMIKGHEYDASFCNARTIMSPNLVPDSNLNVPEIDEIIHTVDDIAEGGGEMAALATLMYGTDPIQNCLSIGSVKRHGSSSAQCTLENLKPTLQQFPTLWRTLVAASFGHDTTSNFLGPKRNKNALANYLNWRDNIFFSTARDTSLLQMLPCWFPKAVRRLIQLYIQGPLGWQSVSGLPAGETLLYRDFDFIMHNDEHTDINAVFWEETTQKHVQEELYDSSLEETKLGLEHHLHRGRALAAFNHILGVRAQKLKLEGQSGASSHGQRNVHSDVQALLAPLTESEEVVLSSVIPLAIAHFVDSVLVSSCAFLLELCGLSASMLHVDVSALRRISSFYKLSENNEKYSQISPKGSAFQAVSHGGNVVESLARSLADEYLHKDRVTKSKLKGTSNSFAGKQSSRALMLVLQHLEKASLPLMMDGKTCGSWLLTGIGDGFELRDQQKVASQHWNLVTLFCQMHQLPLSTKYLTALARDNDWVGFLSEAQIGGYPFDSVVQVATKEFSDPRLKIHLLTVLKGMQLRKKSGSPAYSYTGENGSETFCFQEDMLIPAELFRILADCERKKNPGESLLKKAKEMSWSILAMIASCFPDVSPLSCLTVWLEITAARETSSIKVNDIVSQIADNVEAAVEATNSLPAGSRVLTVHYNRQNAKRRRLMEPMYVESSVVTDDVSTTYGGVTRSASQGTVAEEERKVDFGEKNGSSDSGEEPVSLSKMVAVLCEQQLFLPLLRAFEMFLPSCSLLPFIRALQAFSQMRLSEASAHLGSFSVRIKDEQTSMQANIGIEGQVRTSWISSTAVKAANAMLLTCPSPYEKRCLLQLLAATDFGDGGSAASYYQRLYWKINLAEPSLRKDDALHLGNQALDDASLLEALEKSGHWEQARNWARQLDASGGPWKSAVHHVTEIQAESMVAEWKEFLWDVPEERVALWGHCQTLFIRYSFPPLQAGLFFLKHAEAVEKDLPARELHELLLLSLQWLSGMINLSNPVYPMHLLREIETRVWLLAVESEAQAKSDRDFTTTTSSGDSVIGNASNIIDKTASLITKMDNHINTMRSRTIEKQDARENNLAHHKNQVLDSTSQTIGGSTKTKRRAKGNVLSRRPLMDPVDKSTEPEDCSTNSISRIDLPLLDENLKIEMSFSKAVLSLLEFGQITASKQLQHKLSPAHTPPEFKLVDVALKLGAITTPGGKISISMFDEETRSVVKSYNILTEQHLCDPLQVLESLATMFTEGSGRGLCKRIIAVVKAANVLGLSFSEAFDKQPIELLRLLALKAQESFEEASLIVQTHSMPAASIAQILAESFLKGLLAAHRGGYMDSQKEEGPAPLLWRFSDFLKWAELCPSEPKIGHALMRLVITGQEIPHACEVELLILSHHFYKSSACLDGVDVLVALAATRVEAYVSEGDFPCLARLITGVGNFHALNFILGILIENGQLDLLLQKYSAAAETNVETAEAVRGFRMAVLTSLKHFNSEDHDAFAMVYNHFDMKHETAALLESRAWQSSEQWFHRYDKDQNEDLLESMRYFIEAAEVHSSIDAGNKTRRACAHASLVSLQIRMPDCKWLTLSETNARRLLVEQSYFQEALIVAEAYGLNQSSEWALVLWNQMLKPELTEEFVAEFVAVLPLQPSMLVELARFYRSEVAARGDQSQFSVWLTGGGLPAEWAKYLERSFRCLLKRTRDLRLRGQLATTATGFNDIIDICTKALDKVPDNAAPLVLRKGHGGAYLPLM
ncbi:Glycoside hydrolase, family 19, catalytic [Salix suchowensis]|nr:Glycoside hydrolase, family 19, catalytic [Salix suchowensis]